MIESGRANGVRRLKNGCGHGLWDVEEQQQQQQGKKACFDLADVVRGVFGRWCG